MRGQRSQDSNLGSPDPHCRLDPALLTKISSEPSRDRCETHKRAKTLRLITALDLRPHESLVRIRQNSIMKITIKIQIQHFRSVESPLAERCKFPSSVQRNTMPSYFTPFFTSQESLRDNRSNAEWVMPSLRGLNSY